MPLAAGTNLLSLSARDRYGNTITNATGNVTTFSADDFSWTASGGDLVFRYVVFWKDGAVDPLIGYLDTTGTGNMTLVNGNTFTVDIQATGLWTATVA